MKKIREDVRTTVSLAKVVWEMAEHCMTSKGYNNNFSAYVADLIRHDKERQEERDARKAVEPLAREIMEREISSLSASAAGETSHRPESSGPASPIDQPGQGVPGRSKTPIEGATKAQARKRAGPHSKS